MIMKAFKKGYLIFAAFVVIISIAVILITTNIGRRGNDILSSRSIDTIYTGILPNDGTGDPFRTAFTKVNRLIVIADSLDIDSLTNDEMQALKDLEDIEDAVLFHVGDTTVTAIVGKVVFKTSNSKFYGCVRATPTTRWEPFN